jgi:hypothetical protein
MIAKNKDFAKKRIGEVISRLNVIGAHIIARWPAIRQGNQNDCNA